MNSFIKLQAENLARISNGIHSHEVQELKGRIEANLKFFYSADDKIEFLNYYKSLMDIDYFKHREKCSKDDYAIAMTNQTVNYFVKKAVDKVKNDEEKERFWKYGTLIENINIHGNGQIINVGNIEGDINQNLKILNETGNKGISKSIEELVIAIKESSEIQEQQKTEYLDHLKLLSEQALLSKDKRLPLSTLKTIIQYGLGALNTFSSVATVTGTNLIMIAEYFLNK